MSFLAYTYSTCTWRASEHSGDEKEMHLSGDFNFFFLSKHALKGSEINLAKRGLSEETLATAEE